MSAFQPCGGDRYIPVKTRRTVPGYCNTYSIEPANTIAWSVYRIYHHRNSAYITIEERSSQKVDHF